MSILRTRAARSLILVLLSFAAVFCVAEIVQVPWPFEDGVYDQYTRSILEDGDFNLVNQRSKDDPEGWMVTRSGSGVGLTLVGVSTYLAPFFAYRYARSEMTGEDRSRATDFMDVHVLATVFYVFFGVIVFWRAFSALKIAHLKKAIAFSMLATPFVWYLVLNSTSANIFGLAYGLAAMAYFALVRARGARARDYVVLGLAFGLGLAIRQQLVFIGILPLALFWEQRRFNPRQALAFVAGAALPIVLIAANGAYRFGELHDFLQQYSTRPFWGTVSMSLCWASLRYDLFGPNGYLYVSPIYLVAAVAVALGALRRHPLGPAAGLVILAPAAVVVSHALTGFLQDTLAGRHLLEFFFLLVLILASAFRALEKRSSTWLKFGIALCAVLVAWNLAMTASFYLSDSVDTWKWYLERRITFANAVSGVEIFAAKIGWQQFSHALRAVALNSPLLLALSFGLHWLLRVPMNRVTAALSGFFAVGAGVFAVFTILNVTLYDRNVEGYRRAGLYEGKVVGRSYASYDYDGYVEMSRTAMRYYARSGRCDFADELARRLRGYLQRAKTDVESDPIGFVADLNRGVLRPSAYEDAEPARQVDGELREICGISIL